MVRGEEGTVSWPEEPPEVTDVDIAEEAVLVYGDEAWLLFQGDVKSLAYEQWLEKVKWMGRMQ